ncbi:hypothetical protein BYI23_B004490 [Burkholderia sp. YI23]|nr:hypothetical protein BYI23_B004490 [Burkholderia sp. YI23]
MKDARVQHLRDAIEGELNGLYVDYDVAQRIMQHIDASIADTAGAKPVAKFDDPRVQTVYELICDGQEPPKGEHWDGFVARRIVDALFATTPASSVADLESVQQEYYKRGFNEGRTIGRTEAPSVADNETFAELMERTGPSSVADAAGAKPIYQARMGFDNWTDIDKARYENFMLNGHPDNYRIVYAAPPAPSVADSSKRDAIYRKALAMGDDPGVLGGAAGAPSVADAAGVNPGEAYTKGYAAGKAFAKRHATDSSVADAAGASAIAALRSARHAIYMARNVNEAFDAVEALIVEAIAKESGND